MNEIENIDRELAKIDAAAEPLRRRRADLEREKRMLLSQQFLDANEITMDDVELSSGDGKPWFGHVKSFVDWMKEHGTTKRFAEWNTVIYFTQDLLAGRMPSMPATIDHLKHRVSGQR
jgi:hypothetical protein